ncbi:MAG: porin, partial [Bacteroidota bacterium]|nr:porin [Bacteroidota bacterium]
YVYLIQNILQSPFQAVVKYDVYDPNTAVSGNEIGKTATGAVATGTADIKYSTIGLGLNYNFNSNVRLMAYYDIVKNETTSNIKTASTLSDLSKDRKDNVFTFRIQYKF